SLRHLHWITNLHNITFKQSRTLVKTEMKKEQRFAKGEVPKNAMIPESHPLQQLFRESVTRNFATPGVGIRDQQVTGYISSMLCEFCDADQLFKIRNAAGRPLCDVGEMLLESDPVYGEAPSFDRERQVRKHIGDYTLFFTGMFPESINHWRLRRQRLE